MSEREPSVYILASGYNGRLYVGVTSNLIDRIVQHRDGIFDGHTKRYGIAQSVYYEPAGTLDVAVARAKQLKKWRPEWKRNIIEAQNLAWNGLAVGLGLGPLPPGSDGPVDPGTSPG